MGTRIETPLEQQLETHTSKETPDGTVSNLTRGFALMVAAAALNGYGCGNQEASASDRSNAITPPTQYIEFVVQQAPEIDAKLGSSLQQTQESEELPDFTLTSQTLEEMHHCLYTLFKDEGAGKLFFRGSKNKCPKTFIKGFEETTKGLERDARLRQVVNLRDILFRLSNVPTGCVEWRYNLESGPHKIVDHKCFDEAEKFKPKNTSTQPPYIHRHPYERQHAARHN